MDNPQSPTPGPAAPDTVRGLSRSDADSPTLWSGVVDGWVRDRTIRRDALIALTLVLIATVVIACALTGALAPLVKQAVHDTVVRVVAGSLLTGATLGYGALRLRRRRGRGDEPGAGAGTDNRN